MEPYCALQFCTTGTKRSPAEDKVADLCIEWACSQGPTSLLLRSPQCSRTSWNLGNEQDSGAGLLSRRHGLPWPTFHTSVLQSLTNEQADRRGTWVPRPLRLPGFHMPIAQAVAAPKRKAPPEGQVLLFKLDQGGDRKKAQLRTLGRDSMADADFTS